MSAEDFAAVRENVNGHKIVVDKPDGAFTYQIAPSTRPALAALARLEARIAATESREQQLRGKVSELEQERDEARVNGEGFRSSMYAVEEAAGKQRLRAEAAEARCEALTAALREIADPDPVTKGDWGATYDWHAIGLRGRDIARAALATSEQARTEEGTT
jgi:hypothetical protein